MSEIVIKNIIRKKEHNGEKYFQVYHYIGTGKQRRVLKDCETFESRKLAKDALPEMTRDMIESIEKGII
jgi:hypothetical protein